MKFMVFTVIMILMLVGCSKDQDPLAGEDQSIRQGTPRGKVTPPDPPISTEEVLIEMEPAIAQFEEGLEAKIKFSVRILDPDVKKAGYDISITNLDDFAGATFDEITGEFVWTPASDFVTGDRFIQVQNLQFRVITRTVPAVDRIQNFSANVYRSAERPEITRIEGLKDMVEGQSLDFSVYVRDFDSDGVTPPTLRFLPLNNRFRDASTLMTLRRANLAKSGDPINWIMELKIDAIKRELTNSKETFGFGLVVNSPFGISSKISVQSLDITTKVPAPVSTLNRRLETRAGEVVTYSFDVYTPFSWINRRGQTRSDGDLSLNLAQNCIENFKGDIISCSCRRETVSRQSCKIKIRPEYNSRRAIYEIVYKAKNSNSYNRSDIEELKFVHSLIVNQQEKPIPKPVPIPTPVPTPKPISPNP